MCNTVLFFSHFFVVCIFELYKLYMGIQPNRKKTNLSEWLEWKCKSAGKSEEFFYSVVESLQSA